jgi:exonuclease III
MDSLTLVPMNGLNKAKSSFILLLLVSGLIITGCVFQKADAQPAKKRGDLRIMFYNTENSFDTFNDPVTNDEEFLPESERRWTPSRYYDKLTAIFKTIAAVGETSPPDIICFAEIENRKVLLDLLNKTPLEKYTYEIVHYDSPDQRGIDVAMLCRKDVIKPIFSQHLRISYSGNSENRTRDILYVKIQTNRSDTIHLFVNHWPSRRGGKTQSEGKRQFVAMKLKHKTDSILRTNPASKIIITGDFNDEPRDKSIFQSLNANLPGKNIQTDALYNLSGKMQADCNCGTYRYKANWDMLDQFIVSGSLLLSQHGLHTCIDCIDVADYDFLLREDKKYGGKKPFPTYQGPQYQGGFSDHLPIYLDLFY